MFGSFTLLIWHNLCAPSRAGQCMLGSDVLLLYPGRRMARECAQCMWRWSVRENHRLTKKKLTVKWKSQRLQRNTKCMRNYILWTRCRKPWYRIGRKTDFSYSGAHKKWRNKWRSKCSPAIAATIPVSYSDFPSMDGNTLVVSSSSLWEPTSVELRMQSMCSAKL